MLRALLDTRSKRIHEKMCVNTAYAMIDLEKEGDKDHQLKMNYLIPKVNDSILCHYSGEKTSIIQGKYQEDNFNCTIFIYFYFLF
jgi:malic enzyme